MTRDLEIPVYRSRVILARNRREFARALAAIPDVDPEMVVPWDSAAQTQRIVSGEFGKSPPACTLLVSVDVAGLAAAPLDLTASIAMHEATHAALMLLDWAGHEYDGEDEPAAYLIAHIGLWLLGQLGVLTEGST